MRYLLDTCTWIFLLNNDTRINEQQKQIVRDSQNNIYISVVSAWEMTIKVQKGKLELPKLIEKLVFEACIKDNFKILNLDVFSVLNTKNLPNHYKDPFDRILISQAIDNDLTVITNDKKFLNYDVKVLIY